MLLSSFHSALLLLLLAATTPIPTSAFFPADSSPTQGMTSGAVGLLRTPSAADASSIMSEGTTRRNEVTRDDLLRIIGDNPGGHLDDSVREAFASKLREYRDAEGSDLSDVVFAIGEAVFGVELDAPPSSSSSSPPTAATSDDEDLPIVDFDYMKGFMKEVFLSYGVTPDRAEVCSEVLIEADKRGIDSHGLGRLKPIYCDRMDKGILLPDAPIEIVTECEATALVDGNLGIGLYIGPHCMQMAIDKAKRYGVGFVACRNSTVSVVGVSSRVSSSGGDFSSSPPSPSRSSCAISCSSSFTSFNAALRHRWVLCHHGHRPGMVRRVVSGLKWRRVATLRVSRLFSPDRDLAFRPVSRNMLPIRLLIISVCISFSIGLTGTNARPSIAPTFGTEPM